jgi:hypothetical protein
MDAGLKVGDIARALAQSGFHGFEFGPDLVLVHALEAAPCPKSLQGFRKEAAYAKSAYSPSGMRSHSIGMINVPLTRCSAFS